MFHQTIVGKPKCCLNRTCKHPFFFESFLGWLPKSPYERYVIMRCVKCHDTFKIIQLKSMIQEYKNSLPKDPTQVSSSGPISKQEITSFKKKLEQKDSLKTLLEGYKPGGSILPDDSDM